MAYLDIFYSTPNSGELRFDYKKSKLKSLSPYLNLVYVEKFIMNLSLLTADAKPGANHLCDLISLLFFFSF